MNRRITIIVALLLVSGIAIALHSKSIDGVEGFILGAIVGEDTMYTEGYTDEGFKAIKINMTVAQVHQILGPPEKRWKTSSQEDGMGYGERWSWSPGDTNYRCRTILFKNDKVERIHSEYYFD